MPDGADAVPSDAGAPASYEEDARIVDALRAGDEQVFADLVDRYTGALQRLAQVYVKDPRVAEEVVQETWIGLLQSINRFEGRSSLKTWLFRILMNCARSRARKESRSIPFSAMGDALAEGNDLSVDPDRFQPADGRFPGHWAVPPGQWHHSPELQAVSSETRTRIGDAIRILPDAQREVITLRDVEGLTSTEVCNLLRISDTNQRVLLHRARSKVRRELEAYLEGAP